MGMLGPDKDRSIKLVSVSLDTLGCSLFASPSASSPRVDQQLRWPYRTVGILYTVIIRSFMTCSKSLISKLWHIFCFKEFIGSTWQLALTLGIT